jgi:NADH-quinone oxidoreductase subunit N
MVSLENFESLRYFLPEFTIAGTSLLIFVLDLILGKPGRRIHNWIGIAGLALAGLLSLEAFTPASALNADTFFLFENMLALDGLTRLFRLFFVAVGILTLLMSSRSKELERSGGEFPALLLIVVLGMNLMAASANLLMAYLAMETVSIISYTLVGSLRGSSRSHEAGLKYVIFGGIASGAMLYGFSWLYGMTGTLDIAEMAYTIQRIYVGNELGLLFAVVLVLVGLGFKMAAVPFHMWCPDVYEGAPISVTAFLSVGPKAAGIALTVRVLYGLVAVPVQDRWVPVGALPWPMLLAVISVATMFVGNLSALWQNNLKRLMAYSSIAHAGYLLMGLVLMNEAGLTAIVFYLFAYLLMNFGAFMIIAAVADASGSEEIEGVRGLWKRNPFLAVMMAVFLFSLTGLPPAFGFIGKFYLFAALIESGWFWLAVVGLLNSVISLAYYMRIGKAMLIDGTDENDAPISGEPLRVPALISTVVGVLAGLTILFGIYWEPIRVFAENTFGII